VVLRLVVVAVVLVVVQRGARSIVADLLRQRLPATPQGRTQVVGDLRLGQQLLEHLVM